MRKNRCERRNRLCISNPAKKNAECNQLLVFQTLQKKCRMQSIVKGKFSKKMHYQIIAIVKNK